MKQLGRYEILEVLGEGAMGTVYRAHDPKINRTVAIKVVRVMGVTPEQEAEYRRRFFREAQSAGKLTHPGIVTIYDVGEDEFTKTPYIVMEFIQGLTLEHLLTDSDSAPITIAESLSMVGQLADALDCAHSQEIIHRDVKPANIIITANRQAKIMDFGIAKLTQSDFTIPGQILGTLAYLAPEQLTGGKLDGRADLFSLGVILYWMLTGKRPFEGNTNTILYQVACVEPASVLNLNAELPQEIDAVMKKVLAKDPADRYRSGKEFAQALDDLAKRVPQGIAARHTHAVVGEGTVVERRTQVMDKPITPRPSTADQTVVDHNHPYAAAGRQIKKDLTDFSKKALHKVRERQQSAAPVMKRVGNNLGEFYRRAFRSGSLILRRRSWKSISAVAAVVVISLAFFLWRGASEESGEVLAVFIPKNSTLEISSTHNFRSANLSVWVDDELTYEATLTGSEERRWLVRKVIEGYFSATAQVAAGDRLVRVRLYSPEEGYDQTQEIKALFSEDQTVFLVLGFTGRSRTLDLSVY